MPANTISIHAPRTGSDMVSGRSAGLSADFNPRSPHGERHGAEAHRQRRGLFQSTLPARGATQRRPPYAKNYHDFNPRSPHGERRPIFLCL